MTRRRRVILRRPPRWALPTILEHGNDDQREQRRDLAEDEREDRRLLEAQGPQHRDLAEERAFAAADGPVRARPRQSILYWRKNIFDPDRLFTVATARVDFFRGPDGVARALELNATIPAMQGYSDLIAHRWLAEVADFLEVDYEAF